MRQRARRGRRRASASLPACVASRKEEKERLRAAREQAETQERSAQRKRLFLGYAVAGLITAAVIAGIITVIAGGGDGEGTVEGGENERVNEMFGVVPEGVTIDDRDPAEAPGGEINVVGGDITSVQELADEAGCELELDQDDEGNTHIDPDSKVPDYGADPPSSGDHAPQPLADGAFESAPSPLHYVHALEHGRIVVHYSSELAIEQQLQLLGLYDESRPAMILFPNDEQPYLIAATAWRNTMACDQFEGEATLDAIRGFREAFRGRGPEAIPLQ